MREKVAAVCIALVSLIAATVINVATAWLLQLAVRSTGLSAPPLWLLFACLVVVPWVTARKSS